MRTRWLRLRALLDANEILWDTLSRHRRPDAPQLPAPGAAQSVAQG